MKSLIKRIQNIFSRKNSDNIDVLCNGMDGELNDYCSLEYTYKKKANL